MRIEDQVVLVTGANRGIGRALAEEFLRRGATVYGAARNPATITDERVRPLALDVTDPASIAAAVGAASDVTVLVNNAGISGAGSLLTGDADRARLVMATNLFGPVDVTRAFAPVLARNGGGAVVNLLSVLSWAVTPATGAYSAAKAAAWAFTNAARAELRAQGTHVLGVHMARVATDMTAGTGGPKADPADIATQVVTALADDRVELLADDATEQVKALLTGSPDRLEL